LCQKPLHRDRVRAKKPTVEAARERCAIDDGDASAGTGGAITLRTGAPVVAFQGSGPRGGPHEVRIAVCTAYDCQERTVSPVGLSGAYGGYSTAVEIGDDGNPLIGILAIDQNYEGTYHVVKCRDPSCSEHADPITIAEGGTLSPALLIPADGLPIMAVGGPDLRLAKCSTRGCDDAVDIRPFNPGGDVRSIAVAADRRTNPVFGLVTWQGEAVVIRCEDPSCLSAAGPTSIAAADGDRVGIVIDAEDRPMLVFTHSGELMLATCGNPDCSDPATNRVISLRPLCTGGTYGVADPVLALDGCGNPLVAFHDACTRHVSFIECGDRECSDENRADMLLDPDRSYGYARMGVDNSGGVHVAYRGQWGLFHAYRCR
jgi:hypothetical protein